MEGFLLGERNGREGKGDWSLGTGTAEEKGERDRERDKERDRDRQTEKERWELGRALLKGNVVNVHRRCS